MSNPKRKFGRTVEARIEHFVYKRPDDGVLVDSTRAVCTDCNHRRERDGTDDVTERYCLTHLRDECPRGEFNYYKPEKTPEKKNEDIDIQDLRGGWSVISILEGGLIKEQRIVEAYRINKDGTIGPIRPGSQNEITGKTVREIQYRQIKKHSRKEEQSLLLFPKKEESKETIHFEKRCPFVTCREVGPHDHEICSRCKSVISCKETKPYHEEGRCRDRSVSQ